MIALLSDIHSADEMKDGHEYTCDHFFSVFHLLRSRGGKYIYKQGTTPVLTKTITPLNLDVVEESVQMMDSQ